MLSTLQQALTDAAARRIRLPVLLQGEESALLTLAAHWLAVIKPKQCWWLGKAAPANVTAITNFKAHQLLGNECDWLIINAFSGFDADKIAASAGALKAGGLWLLLAPPDAKWQHLVNPAHQRLRSYPTPDSHTGYFIAFWLQQLQHANLIRANEQGFLTTLNWPAFTEHEYNDNLPCKTAEQAAAVAAIIKVATGHRRRPLLLLADRGCGKSAALGIAAAQLAQQDKQPLLITAPAKTQAAVALQHFAVCASSSAHLSALRFVAIDELLQEKPAAALLLIDEAAAIPAPQLQQLLDHYSRVVFASTEHGYEGTGRGFQLRFQPYLAKRCPDWRLLRLAEPIRYQQQDPLEILIRNGFLLATHENTLPYNKAQTCEYVKYTARSWLAQPEKLQQVFALLSLAHYQTQVKDLAALLDNPALSVYTLEQNEQVLCCALVSAEGKLPDDLSLQIYQGKRRVQGQLLAQSLAFYLTKPDLATLPLARIMRIAVQPEHQQQGLGTLLLKQLSNTLQHEGYPLLGSSFGVTDTLLQFWQKNGYQVIRLGNRLDKASAEPSVLVLKSLHQHYAQTLSCLAETFSRRFYHELTEYPANLDPQLIIQLAKPHPIEPLTASMTSDLRLFANGQRPIELVFSELLSWFNVHYPRLPANEQAVFVAKLWQKQPWPTVCARFQLAGKAAAIKIMQQALQSVPQSLQLDAD